MAAKTRLCILGPSPFSAMKILVVDDSKSTLTMLSACIQQQGLEVLPCGTGAEAIQAFQDNHPDLVLLDVVLPDIDGYEVAMRIRSMEKPGDWTPITFLTAMTRDEDLARGIEAGGDDYLFKPISEVVLEAKIRAMRRIIQMRQSLVVLAHRLDLANRELKRISSLDGLTGVGNRRQFDELIDREWRRAIRNKHEISLLMCDVDYFKLYNDSYGHQAGDSCLQKVAGVMTECLGRGADMACRYGGEEFVIVLPETGMSGAYFVAERIREGVFTRGMKHEYSPFGQVSLSIGVSCMSPDVSKSAELLIKTADHALYAAKQGGRNRVCRAATDLGGTPQ